MTYVYHSMSRAYPIIEPSSAIFTKCSQEEIEIGKGTAGFDAIFQFRADFLTGQLRTNLMKKPYDLEASFLFDSGGLSDTVMIKIKRIIAKLNATISPKIKSEKEGFKPAYFRIAAHDAALEFDPDPDKEVTMKLDVVVYLHLGHGQDIWHPLEWETTAEPLAFAFVTMYPKIKLVEDQVALQVNADLDFTVSSAPVIGGGDKMFQELRQTFLPTTDLDSAVQGLLAPLMTDHVSITPRMCIGGKMYPGETLPGIGAFDVSYVIRDHLKSSILGLCVETSAGGSGAGLGLVRPFLGTSNFGYFFSEKVANGVFRSRWARKSTIKKFTGETKVPLEDPDNSNKTVYGKAKVKWVWKKMSSVHVLLSPGTLGALRLKTVGELTILELWNHKNEKVAKADYPDLFKTVTRGYAVDLFLFENPVATPVADAVANQGMQLLQALYRPTVNCLKLQAISGVLSGAVGGGIVRGTLSQEGV